MPFNKHKAFQVFKQLVRGYYFQKYLISEHKNEFEAELSSLLSNASTFIDSLKLQMIVMSLGSTNINLNYNKKS